MNRVLVILFFYIGSASAVPPLKKISLEISKSEFASLESVACINQFSVNAKSIWKYSLEGNSQDKYAEVTCLSRSMFKNNPSYYIVECSRRLNEWKCNRNIQYLVVPIQGRNVALSIENITPEIAYTSLEKISKFQFQSSSIDAAIGVSCSAASTNFKDEIEYVCGENSIGVSLFCPVGGCPRVLWLRKLNYL